MVIVIFAVTLIIRDKVISFISFTHQFNSQNPDTVRTVNVFYQSPVEM